jgi:hypothetical protein
MGKTMFALTYCYEGVEDSLPYSTTIAVSEDKDKLIEKMTECATDDTMAVDNEDEEWETDRNYSVWELHPDIIKLRHNKYIDLYASYEIREVEVL